MRMQRYPFGLFVLMLVSSASSQTSQDPCLDDHDGPCKRSSQCQPKITPSNSTHLLVNWEEVSEGCESHIESIRITTTNWKSFEAFKFEQKYDSVVEANPCLHHSIAIGLIMTQSYIERYGRGYMSIPSTEYNTIERQDSNYPYGGLLQKEMLPKICLKENGTVSVPNPPVALKNCEVTSGDVEESEEGSTGKVRFTFKNPQNPGTEDHKEYEAKDIKMCKKDSTVETNKTTVSIIAIAASSATAAIATICLVVFCCKAWLEIRRGKRMEKQDECNVYGLYYTEDGETVDQGTVEVVDVNDYYG